MLSKFTKNDIDHLLYEVAKEYQKRNRKNPEAEIILVGGSSIVINYSLRDSTTDFDAMIRASSTMKEIIRKVADENGLSNDWLNEDFKKTLSFSSRLVEHSIFYKKIYGLSIRTVAGEYLIAMKLVSGRRYKNDLSDIVGIIYESSLKEKRITYEDVDKAIKELYGGWKDVKESSTNFLKDVFAKDDLASFYEETKKIENENKDILISFQETYDLKESDVDNVITNHRKAKHL